jgi:uncharacterized membrane protein YwaF
MSHFGTGISITAFSIPHLVYLGLIFGTVIGLWLCLRRRDDASKEKALRLLAYALVLSYLSDFFVHEFVYGEMNIDKLPFHICTVLCPLAAIAQFNLKGHKLREPIAMLAVLAPMMYLCYPASIGDGEPWCYQAVQTMFYHGTLMAWGILTLALGVVKPDIRNCWKSGITLVGITLWAKLGNVLLEHNWFFLEEDAFYIGLVENGVIPKWLLMVLNPVVFFLAVLLLYGVCYGLRSFSQRKAVVHQ